MCGGWQTADISLSNTKTGYIKGNYLNTCEWIKKGLKWEESSATMIKHRAFFSMAATENAIFAFGGKVGDNICENICKFHCQDTTITKECLNT